MFGCLDAEEGPRYHVLHTAVSPTRHTLLETSQSAIGGSGHQDQWAGGGVTLILLSTRYRRHM